MFHDDIFCTFSWIFKGPEKAIVFISQYEVGIAHKNGPNSTNAEATMTEAIEGVNKSAAQSHDQHPGTYVSTVKENHPEFFRAINQEGPELVLIQVGMVFHIEEGEEIEIDHDSSCIAGASSHHDISILKTLQVQPNKSPLNSAALFECCQLSMSYCDPTVIRLADHAECLKSTPESGP
ncbi:hypothetical protein U9M48_021393 [Paspalum notatum var. saurae]|uniref:Uncharacterized protein n=1 Tax=Paspalum notatum var. saurae TaxID=547442 RepID=A0AAQ3WSW4_PASNO